MRTALAVLALALVGAWAASASDGDDNDAAADRELAEAMGRLRDKLNPEPTPLSPEEAVERAHADLRGIHSALVRTAVGNPDLAARNAVAVASAAASKEVSYLRYFDLSDVPRARLPEATAALFFTCNQASSTAVVYRPVAVPGSDGRLFRIDLRWYGWTAKAWELVSTEDPYFREPLISSTSKALAGLRYWVGNGIVRAGWFVYYTGDASEFLKAGDTKADGAFYYQLLYAKNYTYKTVKKQVLVSKTTHETQRRQYSDGHRTWYQDDLVPVTRQVTETRSVFELVGGQVPKNVKEFQEFWRINGALKDAADFLADRGAIIDEGASQVSYANRIIQRVNTALGVYWRTFDVFRTAGDQDFLEGLPVPLQDKKKFVFDAGEHILITPKGSSVYLLSGGSAQGEARIEFGDPRVVRDEQSGHRLIVTTWKSCVACHDQGVIPLKNELPLALEKGLELKARYDTVEQKRAFYLRELNRLVRRDQEDHADFVRQVNGLTPQENASQYQRFRAWYIGPVSLSQAAREVGAVPDELVSALSVTSKARLGRYVTEGRAIPRTTWERGLYQEAFLLLIEYRKSVNADRTRRGLPPVPLTRSGLPAGR